MKDDELLKDRDYLRKPHNAPAVAPPPDESLLLEVALKRIKELEYTLRRADKQIKEYADMTQAQVDHINYLERKLKIKKSGRMNRPIKALMVLGSLAVYCSISSLLVELFKDGHHQESLLFGGIIIMAVGAQLHLSKEM